MRYSVSVVMPVHNGAPFLGEAVESILAQTLDDFEFLVIDDGSTDNSCEIVTSYRDPRIRLLHSKTTRNRSNALNQAIDVAQGEYIARMDSDDVSLPRRLEHQVAFMEQRPDVCICGTWIRTFGKVRSVWRLPTDPDELRCRMLFHCEIAHPSVMMRREPMVREDLRYRSDRLWSEDWDLWQRASRRFQLANLPEVLLRYRIKTDDQRGDDHASALAAVRHQEAVDIVRDNLLDLGLDPSPEEADLHYQIGFHGVPPEQGSFRAAESWLLQLLTANSRSKRYPPGVFGRIVGEHWFYVCYTLTQLGLGSRRKFRQSSLSDLFRPSTVQWAKFAVRSMVRGGPST